MEYYIVSTAGDWIEAEENTPGAMEYDASEHLDNLINRANTWDRENVRELRDIVDQIREVERDIGIQKIDYTNFPTEEIPAGTELYPIWAVDKKGMALVGDSADQIEPLDDIIEWYAEKPETRPPHTITATGYESLEKVAKRNGNSSAVTLPASWLGHRVLCIRLD